MTQSLLLAQHGATLAVIFLPATYFEVESLTHAGGMEIILSELWPQYFRRRLCGADSNVFSGSKLLDL